MTKQQAINMTYGDLLYHKTKTNTTGRVRVRVSGKCKTWKTRPDEFRLPVKYGLYQSFYITHENADEWEVMS